MRHYNNDSALQDVVVPGSIRRTPAAVADCVSVQEVKDFLHVGYSEDDPLILRLITAAREWVEERTSRAIIKQVVNCRVELYHSIELPFGPLYGDTVITHTPVAGPIVVGPGPFPKLEGRGVYDLEYTAGADTEQVPEGLKMSIMARVAATYENRGDQDKTNYSQVALEYLAPFKRIVSWL